MPLTIKHQLAAPVESGKMFKLISQKGNSSPKWIWYERKVDGYKCNSGSMLTPTTNAQIVVINTAKSFYRVCKLRYADSAKI